MRRPDSNDRPHQRCALALLVAWTLGAVATAILYSAGLRSLSPVVLTSIVFASGAIGLLAITPGFLIERQGLDQRDPASLSVGIFAALLIRLFSTVALMAFGGYQMRSMQEVIAGWIIAWYVYLTAVEVVTLATNLTRQNRRRQSRHQAAGTSVQ
ncbi:MAG: hypothetical protein AAFU85_25950 [Planctomycetota bacterium]